LPTSPARALAEARTTTPASLLDWAAVEEVEAADGLAATVGPDGAVHVAWRGHGDWFGPATPPDRDGIHCTVRADDEGRSLLVFRLEATRDLSGIASGAFAEPAFSWPHFRPEDRADAGVPEATTAFGHQFSEFAFPTSTDALLNRWLLLPHRPPVVWPLWLRAPDGGTLLLAPLDGFHEQVVGVPAERGGTGGLRCGWHGDLDEVPAGFATELAIWAGPGPRACLEAWGTELRRRAGTVRPGRYADELARRPSYWTDNGAAYWYRTEGGRSVRETLTTAVDDLRTRDVPFGTVQLDSWWYPHEVLRPFDTDEWEVPPTGLVRWEAREDILPEGIDDLADALGRPPLAAHIRHLSSSSPYVQEVDCWVDGDRAHPTGPELYERWLDSAVGWGIETFEHDWLVEAFLGVRQLRAVPGRARAWQEGLDRAAGERGITLQWCMASPADFCQTTTLRNVTSIRTSGDHGYIATPGILWAWFLYGNVLARALGLLPYKDVFHATTDPGAHGEVEALLSALSAGPVGIGDRVGVADPALVRRTCRADGLLVKPDLPVAALDRCLDRVVVFSRRLLVGSTTTTHGAGTWHYVVAANVRDDGDAVTERITLAELGVEAPAVVWDWRRRTAEAVEAVGGWDVELGPHEWDYRVVAPVLAGGAAVIGDPDVFVTAGDLRLADVGPDGTVVVAGAPGEVVRLVAWDGGGVVEREVNVPDQGWERLRPF
jgi:hypothetical protein